MECGFITSEVNSFELKPTILSAIIDYHLMFKVKAAMDQFMEGMEVLETLNEIRKNPSSFKNLFVYSQQKIDAGNQSNIVI